MKKTIIFCLIGVVFCSLFFLTEPVIRSLEHSWGLLKLQIIENNQLARVEPMYIDALTGKLIPLFLRDKPPVLVPCEDIDKNVKGWCGIIKLHHDQKVMNGDYVFLLDRRDLGDNRTWPEETKVEKKGKKK